MQFAAAQAAEKAGFVQISGALGFAAAQAAEKVDHPRINSTFWFAAAQAAEETRNNHTAWIANSCQTLPAGVPHTLIHYDFKLKIAKPKRGARTGGALNNPRAIPPRVSGQQPNGNGALAQSL